jgi:ankyrin repeat protein
MATMSSDDPIHLSFVTAVRAGDLVSIGHILAENPGFETTTIDQGSKKIRSPLHVVTDWPGFSPNAPAAARLLLDAGADPNGSITEARQGETPLHWAASSDDVDVAVVLIDAGADIEAPGGSLGGGPPLDNAVGYGCWHVARLLVDRGATVGLWQAAALGRLARLEELFGTDPAPNHDDVNHAFWQACHGGQRRTAEYLLDKGADIDATPRYSDQTPLDIAGDLDTQRQNLIEWLRGRGATSAQG